ncbi:flavoprotein subunit of succinate dehydrogenase/fumarate reductase [Aspergillus egyptiacus]|nr:flavoprotein subunit of succinate dehydrogenase/fumarate reductase [Aspergillus egyptiacus]
MSLPETCDILVVGSGNAGFSAALAAISEHAKSVVLIEKASEEWAGGNSYFTAGAYRTVHDGIGDLKSIVSNVDSTTAELIDLPPYSDWDFRADMDRICYGRSDPELSEILIKDSRETISWLKANGIEFHLSFNRQAYKVDGRYKFWGGLALKTRDGGKSLLSDYQEAARRKGIKVFYSTVLKRLLTDPETGKITSVVVSTPTGNRVIKTGAVVLAAGGFESNPRLRSQYLGPGWDLAKVRGTPFNTGECLDIAIRDASAMQTGNWSGCHSVAWDANAPSHTGNREASNEFTKSGYPLGLMLNADGERFVDEGIDLRNYTYAKFGRAILNQPHQIAFQLWDSRTIPWLRKEEYRPERVERILADSIEELAEKLVPLGLQHQDRLISTVRTYNETCRAFKSEQPERRWDPAILDGLSTQSSTMQLPLAKSNWAQALDSPPFMAVRVTCGITFTFGGLKVVPETAQVVDLSGEPISGLYCAGEMLGGLFYENYPGGSGLTSGAVFGRRAGVAAAREVSSRQLP